MLPRRARVDEYDRDVPTPRQPDSDREATVARVMKPEESAIFARGRARPLYVPSPLPMCELKKAMAKADDEATLDSSPEIFVHEETPATSSVPSSAPTKLHHAQERRLASNVDAEEESANVGWRHRPIPPLPALEEFAPIVPMLDVLPVPGLPGAAMTKTDPPRAKRGEHRFILSILVSLFVAVAALAIVHAIS